MENNLEENPFIYSIGKQASCLVPCAAAENDELNSWIVATDTVKGQNEIISMDFDEELYNLKSSRWNFSTPIKKIAHLFNDYIAVSSGNSSGVYQLTGLNDDMSSSFNNGEVIKVFNLPHTKLASLLWDQNKQNIIVVGRDDLEVYDFKLQAKKESISFEAKSVSSAALHPLQGNEIVVGRDDGKIHGLDLRKKSPSFTIDAHKICVTDLDFNQNKPAIVVSSGKDCQILIWDLRNPLKPLKQFSNHTHWVLNVKFNHFHDQLILSSSSDTRVNLHNMISVSSSKFNRNEKDLLEELHDTSNPSLEEDLVNKTCDGLVSTYEHHGDTVYSLAWSLNDPWMFASLSFDGTFIINTVPSEHKYKIIL